MVYPASTPGVGFPVPTLASIAALSTANAQFGITGNGAVANTVAETTLLGTLNDSATLSAGVMTAGKMLFIYGWGFITNTLTPTLRIRVKVGGVTVLDTTAFTMVTVAGTNMWQLSCVVSCRTVGAGGTGFAQGLLSYFSAANVQQNQQLVNSATFAIDTTIANLVEVTATWGTADPLNVITATNLSAVRLG